MAGGGLCEGCILASKEPRRVFQGWGLWGFLSGQQQDQICIGDNSSGHDGEKGLEEHRSEDGDQTRGERPDQRRETRPEEGHRPEERDKTGGGTRNRGGGGRRIPDWRRETRLEVRAEACSRMQGCVPKETYPLGAPEVALMEGQRGEGRNG